MKTITENKIKLVKWSPSSRSKWVDRFLARPPFDTKTEEVARKILADIQREGDQGIVRYTKKYDNVQLSPTEFRVKSKEILEAKKTVDQAFKKAAAETYKRVMAFAKAGKKKSWNMASPHGGKLGEQYVPLDRVGAYIPGGKAPLASTALMTVTLAKEAGVLEIIACTPTRVDGTVDPYILYALDLAGATEIYKIGGVQAIGAMAYGTRALPKVQKIVGPGNEYVTAAKRLVYGHVGLDLVAGPSEIAILADSSASARNSAADLLSQAEHGTGAEKALFVTTSTKLAEAVRRELVRQTKALKRKDSISVVLKKGMLLVVVENLDAGIELCNRFAPEHFELQVKRPRVWLKKIKVAGAVFMGPWTPEVAGDFVAGPSHVLPTGGAAIMFSGLTIDDFQRRMSVIDFSKKDLKETLPVIQAFSRVEGLDAHGRSAEVRFAKMNRSDGVME